jgi:hypothetical protein
VTGFGPDLIFAPSQLIEVDMQAFRQTSSRFVSTASRCGLVVALGLLAAAGQAQVLADPQRAWQPDPSKRVALTMNTQVVQQPLSWQPRGGNTDLQASPTTQASLGLEFRRKSSTQAAKDLLKVQLTSDSALNFRPRGGGMVVTYRSRF